MISQSVLADEAVHHRVRPKAQRLLNALVCFCLPLLIHVQSCLEVLIVQAKPATIVWLQACTEQALRLHKGCMCKAEGWDDGLVGGGGDGSCNGAGTAMPFAAVLSSETRHGSSHTASTRRQATNRNHQGATWEHRSEQEVVVYTI